MKNQLSRLVHHSAHRNKPLTHLGQIHRDNGSTPGSAAARIEAIQKKNQAIIQSKVEELHRNVETIMARIEAMKARIKATREHAMTVRKIVNFSKPISKEGKPNE
ncbi:hypothetical protein EDC14_104813 [Hydrogenispora ethanolica]|uniref:Uncharacterized protein n=1 Tax=Hydrogenispora ethanolica TaxID=1082276 RepID=A0A4R1QY53_HYDET|nr:hypothetical protein [Hydrogenispora ethanolica]TCL56800.1 hypothetical protein EDC14_104813 [Hydrogenispora ethanolica]